MHSHAAHAHQHATRGLIGPGDRSFSAHPLCICFRLNSLCPSQGLHCHLCLILCDSNSKSVCLARSSIPVVTAVLAIAIEKKVPTRFEGLGLLVLVSGVMLAVWEGAAGSPRGIMLCIAGRVRDPRSTPWRHKMSCRVSSMPIRQRRPISRTYTIHYTHTHSQYGNRMSMMTSVWEHQNSAVRWLVMQNLLGIWQVLVM